MGSDPMLCLCRPVVDWVCICSLAKKEFGVAGERFGGAIAGARQVPSQEASTMPLGSFSLSRSFGSSA